jgi:hypothetical protein
MIVSWSSTRLGALTAYQRKLRRWRQMVRMRQKILRGLLQGRADECPREKPGRGKNSILTIEQSKIQNCASPHPDRAGSRKRRPRPTPSLRSGQALSTGEGGHQIPAFLLWCKGRAWSCYRAGTGEMLWFPGGKRKPSIFDHLPSVT